MFDIESGGLDVAGTLSFAVEARAVADRAEVRLIQAAAQYGDLHAVVDHPGVLEGGSLPGMERLVTLGGPGTPQVAEFAPAELGAVLAMSPHAAAVLIGDALDLRHRLPRLWSRVVAGQVKAWIGRRTAQSTRQLPVGVAATVDARVSRWAPSLSWGRLEAIIDATVIEADPAAAAERVESAARSRGVWVAQSTNHGVKDIYIRTDVPAAIWFDATIDRIADQLGALGDTDTKDVRRARAVGVIANPQHTLNLFAAVGPTIPPGLAAGCGCRTGDRGHDGVGQAASGGAGGLPAEAPASATTPGRDSTVGGCGGCGRAAADARPPATLYVHIAEAMCRSRPDGRDRAYRG